MHRLSVLLLSLFALLLPAACRPGNAEARKQFDNKIWHFNDSLSLPYLVSDASQIRRLKLRLEVTDEYAYRNIFIRFHIRTPRGKLLTSIPQFILTDESGTWTVKKDWLGSYNLEAVINPRIPFEEKGLYLFSMQEYMRTDSLRGIKGVSLRLEELE